MPKTKYNFNYIAGVPVEETEKMSLEEIDGKIEEEIGHDLREKNETGPPRGGCVLLAIKRIFDASKIEENLDEFENVSID